MPALTVLRAALVILGLLAIAPAQAGGVAAWSEAGIRTCTTCEGLRANDRDERSSGAGLSQVRANSTPDDGTAAGPVALLSRLEPRVGSPTGWLEVSPESVAGARLDRPPKAE